MFLTNISLEELTVLADPTENETTNEITVDPLEGYVPKTKEEGGELHYILEENTKRREESTKHFLMEDGSGLAVVYPSPVHYLDDVTNTWIEIDNTLQYVSDKNGTGYYTNTSSDMVVRLATSALSQNLVSITLDEEHVLEWRLGTIPQSNVNVLGSITETPMISNSTFTIDEPITTNHVSSSISTLTTVEEIENYNQEMSAVSGLTSSGVYEDVITGIDVEYVLNSKQLKENIILDNANVAIDSLGFIMTHTGATLRLETDGSVSVVDNETEEVIYVMQAPFMTDNAGVYTNNIHYVLETIDDSHTALSFDIDKEWLYDEERSWPVVIDPVTTTDSFRNIQDTFVTQLRPDETHAGYGNFMVGYDNTAYGVSRGYLKFNSFPTLEPGDSIYDARIYYYRTSFSSYSNTPFYLVAREAASTWNESTLTWNTQPNFAQAGAVIDYSYISPMPDGTTYFPQYINVTKLIRKWYSEGSNNKGLVLSLADETVKGNAYFVSGTNANAPEAAYPTGYFYYRNALGLESYWTNHTQSAGTAGVGYVNDFNGNLVLLHGDTQTTSVRSAVGLTHVYNVANVATDNGYGKGWTLDGCQTLLPTTGKINENGFPYVYVDGDGTKHYFYNDNGTLKDEDGLGLVITQESSSSSVVYYRIIKTKDGSRYVFDNVGNLRRVLDKNNNTIRYDYTTVGSKNVLTTIQDASGNTITLSYDSSYTHLTSIRDEAGRTTSFGYNTNGCLTSITYPDGTISTYIYDSSNRLIGAQSVDGYKINYEYTTTMGVPQVSKIYETSGNSTGRSLKIDYPTVGTTIFTECGLDGTLTGVEDNQSITYHFDSYGRTRDLHDEEGAAAMYEYYSEGAKNNKLQTEGTMQKTIHNLFVNGGANRNWDGVGTGYTGTDNGIIEIDTSEHFLDDSSFRIIRTAESGSKEWYQNSGIALKPNTTYTFSAYVKTQNITGSGIGAYLSVVVNGTTTYSEGIKGTTETALDNGWTRLSITFTTGSSQTSTKMAGGISGCTGTAWFDCIQLEEGESANRYNLLTNNSFELQSSTLPYGWQLHTGNATTDKSETTSPRTGTYNLSIQGVLGGNKRVNQCVAVSGQEGDIFTLSGWAKLSAFPDTNVRIGAAIIYEDGSFVWKNFDLNYFTDEWQYLSGVISTDDNDSTKNEKYVRIDVYIFYDNNYNIAYFDDLQLNRDDAPTYVYDNEGNLKSATSMAEENSFSYDSNSNLTKLIDATGTSFDYTYDSKKNLIKAVSSDGITYDITNDSYGNPTAVKITGKDGSTQTLNSSMTYDSSGQQVLTVTDCNGDTVTNGYDTAMRLLTSATDKQGTTNYTWNSLNDRLLTVSRTGSGGTSTVSYTYDNAGTLTKIDHNGFSYTFTYDAFGNTTSVKAGNRTLVTKEYLTNNGELSKITYGNGATVNYTYDEKGRVNEIKFGNTVVCTNVYDAEGRIYRQITPEDPNGIEYRYDSLGRLIGIDGTVKVRIGYDDKNRMNALTSIADGKTTKTEYTYGDMSQITAIKVNGTTVVQYAYDGLGRRTSTTYPDAGGYENTISYKTNSDGTATTNPNVLVLGSDTYTYQYDTTNTLYGINRNSEGLYHGFYFDSLGQLIRESLKDENETILYTYDTGGNITSKKHYSYTTGTPSESTLLYTDTYTYGDSSWKDLLTAYNGQSITYDGIGNALTWRDGMNFTWVNGRQLATLTKSGTTASYTYDVDGIRTSKTVNGVTTTYYLNGSQILS